MKYYIINIMNKKIERSDIKKSINKKINKIINILEFNHVE